MLNFATSYDFGQDSLHYNPISQKYMYCQSFLTDSA